MQYSLNKDLQHLKWQQLRSWISFPRLPGCDGQAADAVSVYTQVKNGRCSQIIENSKIGVSRHWDSSTTDTNGQNHGPVWKTQSFLLKGICTVILWPGLLWERQFEKILWKHGWEKIPNWECLFCSSWKRIILLCVCGMTWNWLERNKILIRCGKYSTKKSDLGEPTSFLDHVYLGCTQRQCETSKDIVDNYRTMFESRISAGGVEKLPYPQNLRISPWSYDMAGHAKKFVERYCELAIKTTQQLYKVSTPRIDDHHFTEEEIKSFWRMVTSTPLKCVLKCFFLATSWTTRFFCGQ